MSRKQLAMILAAAALCLAAGAAPVSAQQSCGNLYNQVMETYQTLGPQSPQYAQMVDRYNANCFSGSSMPGSAYPAPAGGEGGGASVPGDNRPRHHDYRSQRG
jgi:hypothetical protein